MDSITSRFREIFKRGLYEYAKYELNLDVRETDDVDTLRIALANVHYVCKDTLDPPLYMAIALTEALEEAEPDRMLIRQKGYEIYQNLKREHSVDHRLRIIKGDLPLRDLVLIDSKELAPESVKRRRKEEEQKYLKEQVIIPSQGAGEQEEEAIVRSPPPQSPVMSATPKEAKESDELKREVLSVPGSAPKLAELQSDLKKVWSESVWEEIEAYAGNNSIPDPHFAMAEAVIDRLSKRLDFLKQTIGDDGCVK